MNGSLSLHPKVAGGTVSGALTLIILWVLSLWHVTVPPEIAAAGTLILATLGAYFAPLADKEQPGKATPTVKP